ncbi:thioredoxin family protein [bacterium]|nr:thioredoxin family protein [bacterium]
MINQPRQAAKSALLKRILIAGIFLVAAGTVLALKYLPSDKAPVVPVVAISVEKPMECPLPAEEPPPLPQLVEVGSKVCVACKMMMPIIDGLRSANEGKLEVVFVDVREETNAPSLYNVFVIPTQIFYAADGQELFRHEGFYSTEEILAKWKEFGIELDSSEKTSGAADES